MLHLLAIDLMHNDTTAPKVSMRIVITLKFKMAASSASSGRNNKGTGSKAQTNFPSR